MADDGFLAGSSGWRDLGLAPLCVLVLGALSAADQDRQRQGSLQQERIKPSIGNDYLTPHDTVTLGYSTVLPYAC